MSKDKTLGLATPIGRRDFGVGMLLGGTAMATITLSRAAMVGATTGTSSPPQPPATPAPGDVTFLNPPDATPDSNNIYSLRAAYVNCEIWGQDARLIYYYDMNNPVQESLYNNGGKLDGPVVAPTLRVTQQPGECAFMGVDLVNAIPFDAANYFNYLYFGDDTRTGSP